jgi:hypothetical protein
MHQVVECLFNQPTESWRTRRAYSSFSRTEATELAATAIAADRQRFSPTSNAVVV